MSAILKVNILNNESNLKKQKISLIIPFIKELGSINYQNDVDDPWNKDFKVVRGYLDEFKKIGLNADNLKKDPQLQKRYILECPYYTYTDVNDKVHTLIFESLEYAQEFEKNLENAIDNFYDKYNDYVLNMN